MTSALIRQPALVNSTAPRGALWAADFAATIYRFFQRIGTNRARRSLREAASKWEAIDPQRAAVMRSAEAHLTSELNAGKA